jgi:hypothetical protein
MALESRVKSGANWFYWIAALSVINTVIILAGGNWSFIIGLGITQVADWIAVDAIQSGSNLQSIVIGLAVLVDLIAIAVCIVFGVFANRKRTWAFVIGMVLYGLDGLLFLAVRDYLSIGFHIFALWCIYRGLRALRDLKAIPDTRSLGDAPTM